MTPTLADRLIALSEWPIYSGAELNSLRRELRACAELARRMQTALEEMLAEQSRQALEEAKRATE